MTLAPTRIRPARAVRSLFRPRVAGRFLALVVAGVLLGSLPVPGAHFAAWLLSIVVVPPLLWAALRPTPAERARQQQTLRPPRAAHPATAPMPTQRSYRRYMAGQGLGLLVACAFALGLLVAMPFVAGGTFGPDVLPADLPNGAAWALCPLLAVGIAVISWMESRSWWRALGRDVEELSRGAVTVVGFGTSPPFEIFLLDGAVELPPDLSDADLVGVHAASVGRFGDVRSGDVLVRTGPLSPGLTVHLSDGTHGRWTGPLRVVPRSEMGAVEPAGPRGGDR